MHGIPTCGHTNESCRAVLLSTVESVDRILKSGRLLKPSGTSQCGTVQTILYTVLTRCIKS